jgi:hypothetical protein
MGKLTYESEFCTLVGLSPTNQEDQKVADAAACSKIIFLAEREGRKFEFDTPLLQDLSPTSKSIHSDQIRRLIRV